MTATRDEISAWVNPNAWDDQAEAERVIDAILESGSDDEAEWVRLAGGDDTDVDAAAERDEIRAEDAIAAELEAYRAAEATLEEARERLHEAMRAAMRTGVSAYRLAQVSGLSERHVGRIRSGD
jgi:hypothetical protein